MFLPTHISSIEGTRLQFLLHFGFLHKCSLKQRVLQFLKCFLFFPFFFFLIMLSRAVLLKVGCTIELSETSWKIPAPWDLLKNTNTLLWNWNKNKDKFSRWFYCTFRLENHWCRQQGGQFQELRFPLQGPQTVKCGWECWKPVRTFIDQDLFKLMYSGSVYLCLWRKSTSYIPSRPLKLGWLQLKGAIQKHI